MIVGILKRRKRFALYLAIILLMLFSIALRLKNIRAPIGNDMHSFRQTQTAITVQNYFKDGYSFFGYETPVLGKPWRILMEAPVYQTFVYVVMRVLGKTNIDMWGRLVSILFFYFSAFVLFGIVKELVHKEAAFVVLLVYVFSPFNLYWSRAVLIDFTSVFFALLYVYGFVQWLRHGNFFWFFCTLISGAVGYLCKSTTMFSYVYFLAFFILYFFIKAIVAEHGCLSVKSVQTYIKRNFKKIACFSILCIVPVLAGVFWLKYSDYDKSLSQYTSWLTSESLHNWNFGTLQQRLNPLNWYIVINRLFQCGGGEYVCIALSFLYFCNLKKSSVCTFTIIAGIVASILSVFTLFNLYYVHNYYFIAVSPLICIAMGCMGYEVAKGFFNQQRTVWRLVGLFCLVMAIGKYQLSCNREYVTGVMKANNASDFHGVFVKNITEPDERILIADEDWSPCTMYYANRKGMMMLSRFDGGYNDVLKDERYTTFVFHDYEKLDVISFSKLFIEYPKYSEQDVFICKFFDVYTEAKLKPAEDFCKIQNNGKRNSYDLGNTGILKLDYMPTNATVCLKGVVEDDIGGGYAIKIVLPFDRDTVYLNLSGISDSIKTITFDTEMDITLSE